MYFLKKEEQKMNTKDRKIKNEQNLKNNKNQQTNKPPLPEPNLLEDGAGMYDFHGDENDNNK